MRAGRYHSNNIFQHEFGQCQCGKGAVDRGNHDGAARGQHLRNGVGKELPVSDMFDDLGGINHVKLCAFSGQRLGSLAVIINVQPAKGGVRACSLNRRCAGVNACHIGTEPRHGFCQQSTTTANIKNAQPG